MKTLASYFLLVLGGVATPSAEQITSVITAAGGEADAAEIETLLNDLNGKDINELLATGFESIKSCVISSGAAPAAAGGAAPAAEAAAPVKEEKVEEVDALDGGMGLFGGAAY